MLRPTLPAVLCLVLPLLVLEGFFAGAEIALLSADRLTLKRLGRIQRRARLALELASHPERVLSTTLLMTNLCMIGVSSVIAVFFLAGGARHAEVLAVLLTSPLIVVLGELIPKTIFQQNSLFLSQWVAYPVYWTYFALYPFTRLLSGYTTRLSRVVGPIEELLTGRKRTTREQLESMLSYGRGETEIKTSAKRMIKRIFDFKDSEAKHALIPLVRVEAVDASADVRETLERFERHRHSRMPVYEDRIDNIIGVVETADLFSAVDLSQGIRDFMSSAHYVAETQSLEDVMLEMRRQDYQMVVVVDEHGGAVGVLTFEDIVEEIVGEISDEYDTDAGAGYKELSERSWLLQARMEIGQINEKLKLDLPEGDYETLSGFLLQQFGRIPEARDELYFTTPMGTIKFTVRKATERHIESVLAELADEPQ